LTHRHVHHSIQNNLEMYELTAADRCLNLMPLFHIGGALAVIPASVAVGASVIYAPGYVSYQVMEWLSVLAPTWVAATPTVHKAILDQALLQPEKVKNTHLRFVRSASSPLPTLVIRGIESTFKTFVLETYGMTEAASVVSGSRFPPHPRKEGSVGFPPGSSTVRAVDDAGNTLPPNAIGELCTRGENVILAYENNPEANGSSFIDGWLRTGDLGYLDDDGYVFITDRVKEVINRGGEKVSPREVDAALLRHPAVKQAAAFSIPHPTLGEDVAAAVVLYCILISRLRCKNCAHLLHPAWRILRRRARLFLWLIFRKILWVRYSELEWRKSLKLNWNR